MKDNNFTRVVIGNLFPLSKMKITKVTDQYDIYRLELSYSQIVAVLNAMSDSHSGPVADELYAALKWNMDRVLKPGEEEEKNEDGDKDDGDEAMDDARLNDFEPFKDEELSDPDAEGPLPGGPGEMGDEEVEVDAEEPEEGAEESPEELATPPMPDEDDLDALLPSP